ncbi:MAG: lipopolysaccharide biosynthesis protein [Saprospiraceae bacterium]|nr:lipopolysaccharide biosynthesis protein [Saprospiraceae bacterium]
MGIIQRQGIKHSIVSFTGLAIATASTIFIYSQKEVVEAYGLVQFLLSIGIIGFPLFALSSNTLAIRFFPVFEDKASGHHGLLPMLLLLCLAGWGLCAGVAAIFWPELARMLAGNSALLQRYLWMAFPLTLLFTLALLLTQYSFNFKRIVIPMILLDFSVKVLLPVLMVAIWQDWIGLDAALWLLAAHYLAIVLGLVVYLNSLGEWFWRPDWSFMRPDLRRELVQYAGFGIVTGFALLVATRLDTLMVGSLTTIKSAGIYAIALNISAAMEIPAKSLNSVSISFVAKYLAEENWAEMEKLYQKVSINLLAAGLLIFGVIWVSVDDLFQLMPNTVEISKGKYVLLILSAAKLIDLAAGLNNQIVYYSKHYRFSLVSMSVLALANIGFNLWLIPWLGLTGAAVATFISITCYNLSNLVFVWKNLHMQPFSKNTAVVIVLAVASATAVWFLPSTSIPLVNIALRGACFTALFAVLVLRFRVSEDVQELWLKVRSWRI